ncbi:MAG: hypothetical protein K6T75_07685 [Acetobacteraceae bacterium]|nr:hypothetical protein [Acetobacteraceae bacterium]
MDRANGERRRGRLARIAALAAALACAGGPGPAPAGPAEARAGLVWAQAGRRDQMDRRRAAQRRRGR